MENSDVKVDEVSLIPLSNSLIVLEDLEESFKSPNKVWLIRLRNMIEKNLYIFIFTLVLIVTILLTLVFEPNELIHIKYDYMSYSETDKVLSLYYNDAEVGSYVIDKDKYMDNSSGEYMEVESFTDLLLKNKLDLYDDGNSTLSFRMKPSKLNSSIYTNLSVNGFDCRYSNITYTISDVLEEGQDVSSVGSVSRQSILVEVMLDGLSFSKDVLYLDSDGKACERENYYYCVRTSDGVASFMFDGDLNELEDVIDNVTKSIKSVIID